ncbi:hypothetical protein [Spirillospora sp. NPDC047279]|uniref:hypothetical protein n=1 Tax=Spirillospora sp. NPDC047279 TaxID=3155478 RepID=UPI0033D66CD5
MSDSTAGRQLLINLAAQHLTIIKARSDTGYRTQVIDHAATWASTWNSPDATPRPGDLFRHRDAGWSSGRSDGSWSTAAWPTITRPCPHAPKP